MICVCWFQTGPLPAGMAWSSIFRPFVPTGTTMFSAPAGGGSTARLTPAGDEGGPDRFIHQSIKWLILVLYLDENTITTIDDCMLLHARMGHPGERVSLVIAHTYNPACTPSKQRTSSNTATRADFRSSVELRDTRRTLLYVQTFEVRSNFEIPVEHRVRPVQGIPRGVQ